MHVFPYQGIFQFCVKYKFVEFGPSMGSRETFENIHKDWQKYFNSVIGSCELNHARRYDDSNNHKAFIITSINNSL